MLNRFFIAACITFGIAATLFCRAQNSLPAADNLRLQFPDSKMVMLEKQEHLNINYYGGQWNIESKIKEKTLYLSDAQLFSQKSIFITGFDEINNLEAKTLVPVKKGKKTEFQEYAVENVETKDVVMGSIFYSDYKEKKFVYPALQDGAATTLSYTQVNKEPRLLNAFYFSNFGGPVLSSVYSVSVPKNIQIAYKLMGDSVDNIRFEKTEKNDLTTYTWTAENVDDLKPEENAPSSSYYEPHVVVYITRVTGNNNKEEEVILENADGLYKWYYSLVQNINRQPNEEQRQLVATLTKNVPDDTEKTRRIFQWVQSHIKYIAFEDGLGGFVPREANDVCSKKYGDCKDMASILVQMLRLAGVPAYYTWIGSRDKPYSYYDVPSPIVDNHMIATAKLNGQYVFLDATGEYQPFGLPTSMIQGKEAMIGIDKDHYEIVKVPVIAMEENAETENLNLAITDRTINGTGNIAYTGYKKVFAQYDKLRADAAGKSGNFYNEYLRKGSNKFETQQVNATGFNNNNAPELKMEYHFTIPDYVTKAGDKIYVNLNLNRKYQQAAIDKKERKLDKEVEYKYVEDYTYNLQIPDGYELNHLPPNATFNDPEFGYTATYTHGNGSVTLHFRLYINHLMLKKNRFDAWNSMIEKLSDTYQEVVVLKKAG
ncbi:DUF3857 domain-containing protein [Sphingobacteriales bacterium UPWRP_1]|nr:hypothetical protein BVG80_11390 [Sphingobacteriales bacterium TSM_CSM]PSJ72413.1 DUF3857 domain-containing protein [Sphingobacteriales bacterium UPWRP_1]